jgi:DNA-binding response OmpR family regulator
MKLPATPADNRSFRILVVEDDPSIAKLILVNLKKSGFDARFAFDGTTGWQGFRECDPHLVLSDISMPGMNGHDLVAKIREVSIIPVILMTAMDSEEWQMKAFKTGADDYVPKPFNIQLLMARVIANLRRVYRYSASPEEIVKEATPYDDWPTCASCGFMAPQGKFEAVDKEKGRIFACPVCMSRQLTFPLKQGA